MLEGCTTLTSWGYKTQINRHFHDCLPCHTQRLGKLNCMRDDLGQTHTNDEPPTVDYTPLSNHLYRQILRNGLIGYEEFYRDYGGLQSTVLPKRSSLEQYRVIRANVLENPQSAHGNWRPSEELVNEFRNLQSQPGKTFEQVAEAGFGANIKKLCIDYLHHLRDVDTPLNMSAPTARPLPPEIPLAGQQEGVLASVGPSTSIGSVLALPKRQHSSELGGFNLGGPGAAPQGGFGYPGRGTQGFTLSDSLGPNPYAPPPTAPPGTIDARVTGIQTSDNSPPAPPPPAKKARTMEFDLTSFAGVDGAYRSVVERANGLADLAVFRSRDEADAALSARETTLRNLAGVMGHIAKNALEKKDWLPLELDLIDIARKDAKAAIGAKWAVVKQRAAEKGTLPKSNPQQAETFGPSQGLYAVPALPKPQPAFNVAAPGSQSAAGNQGGNSGNLIGTQAYYGDLPPAHPGTGPPGSDYDRGNGLQGRTNTGNIAAPSRGRGAQRSSISGSSRGHAVPSRSSNQRPDSSDSVSSNTSRGCSNDSQRGKKGDGRGMSRLLENMTLYEEPGDL